MADVFISYAREDRDRAARLAAVLGDFGWSVWWDREILAGESFDEVIERELAAARVVIVLWSEHSVTSAWVRAEAHDALERGVLVPALLAQVTPPLAFRRAQSASLVGWRGEPQHPGLESLIASTESRLGPRRPPATARSSAPSQDRSGLGPSEVAGRSIPDGARENERGPEGADGAPIARSPRPRTQARDIAGLPARLWADRRRRWRTLIGFAAALGVLVAVIFVLRGGVSGDGTLVVTPDRLEFTARIGETASEVVAVTNRGGASLDLKWWVTGQLFSVDNSSCPLTMDPGVHCELTILLDATGSSSPSSVTDRLFIQTADGTVEVQLVGTISDASALNVAPDSLDFGEIGTVNARSVSVSNDGDTPLTVKTMLETDD